MKNGIFEKENFKTLEIKSVYNFTKINNLFKKF